MLCVLHKLVIQQYSSLDPETYSKENYDQFAMYFEMMYTLPGGREFADKILSDYSAKICFSGPTGTIPSRLHVNKKKIYIMFFFFFL